MKLYMGFFSSFISDFKDDLSTLQKMKAADIKDSPSNNSPLSNPHYELKDLKSRLMAAEYSGELSMIAFLEQRIAEVERLCTALPPKAQQKLDPSIAEQRANYSNALAQHQYNLAQQQALNFQGIGTANPSDVQTQIYPGKVLKVSPGSTFTYAVEPAKFKFDPKAEITPYELAQIILKCNIEIDPHVYSRLPEDLRAHFQPVEPDYRV